MNPDDFSSLDATMTMIAALDPMLSTVVAYRARLVDEGFSPESAERMAEELHKRMLEKSI